MLSRLAIAGIRFPRRVALLAALFFVVAGVLGGPAPGLLSAQNNFEDPGSQSAHARKQVERATGAEPSAGVLALVRAARPGRRRAPDVARRPGPRARIAAARFPRRPGDRRGGDATRGRRTRRRGLAPDRRLRRPARGRPRRVGRRPGAGR